MVFEFQDIFATKPVIGMIHLLPLPGSPGYNGNWQEMVDNAMRDLELLEKGGVDGVIIENIGDRPYFKNRVPPATVAAMTRIVSKINNQTNLPIGLSVLKNDALSALAIAEVARAQFIRVNILTGTLMSELGLVEGEAAELLRLRSALNSQVMIWGDCLTSQVGTYGADSMMLSASVVADQGGADAVVVSGYHIGETTDVNMITEAQKGCSTKPVLVGSGVTAYNAKDLAEHADGVIVGTYFKRGNDLRAPIDPERVKEVVEIVKSQG